MKPLGEFDKFDNDYTIKESGELGIGVFMDQRSTVHMEANFGRRIGKNKNSGSELKPSGCL
jgi:hypothetical protein